MKKLLTLCLLAITMCMGAQTKKVAVYVIGEDAGINKVLGSKLVSAIARSEEFSAIERTESFLTELNKEQNYQRTGVVDDDELTRLGKQFGVQYICVAAVAEAFGEQYLSARLIDVETAQVERTASSSGTIHTLEGLVNATNSVAQELLTSIRDENYSNAKKVAVYIVRNEAGKQIGRVLGDKLVAGFTNSGRYLAIERTNSFLSQLSKEQNYQRTGAVEDDDISRLGKQFGVQYVCVADVTDVWGEKFISARLIDVETAEVVNSYEVGGEMNTMRKCLKIANEISDVLSQVTIAELAKAQKRVAQEGFVDLGLPSGTCWKKTNEVNRMTYTEAINKYSTYLPTHNQCSELIEKCEWIMMSDGVHVIGPNGNSIILHATENRDKALFYASYLTLPSFPDRFYNGTWQNVIKHLCIWTTKDDSNCRGYVRSRNMPSYYETGGRSEFENWGILLCQQVDALSKREHDDRTLTTQKEYTPIYTEMGETYCDGAYQRSNGQTFETYINSLDEQYFRLSFSFKALSYYGVNDYYKKPEEEQYPLTLSHSSRVLSLCLHNDGTIWIKTNNGNHIYKTNITYHPNQYCDIDIEYYKGWLTINGQKMWVEIKDNYDHYFGSVNYSNGHSFIGYLKDVQVFNVKNIDD